MGHILITGPGRAGTSFLVQLLTRMGCDTGFTPYDEPFHDSIRAGCEFGDVDIEMDWSIEKVTEYMTNVPHIFKAPDWSFKLKGYMSKYYLDIDHIILPFRDFEQAAKSRLDVGLDWMLEDDITDSNERLSNQALIHAAVFGMAMEAAYLFYIPLTIIRFPELVQSVDYCYQRLNPIFDFDYELFRNKYKELTWKK